LVDVALDPHTSHDLPRLAARVPQRPTSLRRVARIAMYAGTLAILLGAAEWHAYAHGYQLRSGDRLLWLFAYLLVLSTAAYAAGLPDETAPRNPYLTAAFAAGAGAILLSLLQLVLASLLLPRLVVISTAACVTLWWGFCAMSLRRSGVGPDTHDRVVFVGGEFEADKLQFDLTTAPERQAALAGVLTPNDAFGADPLVDRFISYGATVLVLGPDAQADRTVVSQASALHEAGARVRTVTDFYDEWLGKLPVSELQRMSLMFDINEIHGRSYARVKRMLDLIIGIVGCVACAVVALPILLGDLVANRGPLLYRQTRVGRNQQPFSILKFRTMRPGVSTHWTTEDDPRITRFGRLLRRTHLDELPQFVNIVRGDLSIVGPRPEQPRYVARLETLLPYYQLRHLVRPGLTGWAQVKYGYAGSERDALEKLQYDLFYLGHQSLTLDLRIIARTIRSMLTRGGR
jgi:lipopolysaccharide/colanic/teichoic acid biosynthesis glycosyltransferase